MPITTHASDARHVLLQIIDEAYNKRAWHGTNLRGSVRGLTPEQVDWRPRNGRRNIAEITVHCAYWKYTVRRHIRGDKRGSFPLKGSNWFELPMRLSADQWSDYLTLLDQQHGILREAIVQAPGAKLTDKGGKNLDPRMHGAALHDIYHTGQIQLIKALHKQAER